jgi:hypothetical protein
MKDRHEWLPYNRAALAGWVLNERGEIFEAYILPMSCETYGSFYAPSSPIGNTGFATSVHGISHRNREELEGLKAARQYEKDCFCRDWRRVLDKYEK